MQPIVHKTALITGASAGLGAEFARQLGAQGYDLILSARREARLQALAEGLQAQYPITVNILVVDLSQAAEIEQVAQAIQALPALELLVNNAGFGTNGSFDSVDPAKHEAMLQVHVNAPVLLCRAALPGMLARKHGFIINVASMAGLLPLRSVLYGSTKAFLITFSQTLEDSLIGSGVHIQALCPGFTITEFHETSEYEHYDRRRIPKLFWLSAEEVVRVSLADLHRRKVICIPGWLYRIAGGLARNSITYGLIHAIAKIRFKKVE